jgi:hypothetical protein
MTSLFRGLAAISLFLISVASTSAQKVEFSADIRVSDGAWRTQTLRLYVGNMRATLRSFEPAVPVSKGDCDEIWPLIVLPVASLLRGSTLIFLTSQSALLESVTIRCPTVVKVLIFDFRRVEPSQEANFQIP